MRVTGVVTQGASRAGSAEYIKTFKVAYSLNGRKFEFVEADGGFGDKVRPYGPKEGLWSACPGVQRCLRAPSGARVPWVVGREPGLQVQPGPQKQGSPDCPMPCGYKQ